MLHSICLAPLVLSLSLELAPQADDEFEFDRRPRRAAPIPDDDDQMLPSRPSLAPDRTPGRPAPSGPNSQAERGLPPARRPRWQAPIGAGDLSLPPLKYVFAGGRGTFSLIGGSGQAAYHRLGQVYLVALRYVRRDAKFSYWSASAGDPAVGQWACSRRAGINGDHSVWQRTGAGWQYFDSALVSKPR